MSQSEVLRILYRLGGKATLETLANEYNKEHFPFNKDYRQLPILQVKKTLQHDTMNLLRDHYIEKTKHKRTDLAYYNMKNNKPVITFHLTEAGRKRLQSLVIVITN